MFCKVLSRRRICIGGNHVKGDIDIDIWPSEGKRIYSRDGREDGD